MSRVLAIPDLQYPFAHPDHLEFLKAVKKKFKPTHVVCLGDEVDFHALSQHDHDPDGYSPGHELDKALEDMKRLYDVFPKVMAVTSNHTERPLRRAFKFGIPRAFLRSYHEFLKAPKGWEWRDQWKVDNVRYLHGEGWSGRNGAINAAENAATSTVIGHLHSHAGIQYSANSERLIFGFNVGCLIDYKAYAFAYGKFCKNKPILGAGIIENGVPQFIPMLLNKNGRWVNDI
jgi:hypothetical protein